MNILRPKKYESLAPNPPDLDKKAELGLKTSEGNALGDGERS
jgi:hypothetical protein